MAATKEELSEFRGEFRAFKDQMVEELQRFGQSWPKIRRDLDVLKSGSAIVRLEKGGRVPHGARVRAIEKHLGIKPQWAA